MKRLAISLALAATATAALATPALGAPAPPSSAPPPTLTGEALLGVDPGSGSPDQSCSAPITFITEGVSTGPYPGTFTETVIIDPATDSFVATFRIVSGTTIVTGTKTQGPAGPSEDLLCETFGTQGSSSRSGTWVTWPTTPPSRPPAGPTTTPVPGLPPWPSTMSLRPTPQAVRSSSPPLARRC
jgi:hypothetical protein